MVSNPARCCRRPPPAESKRGCRASTNTAECRNCCRRTGSSIALGHQPAPVAPFRLVFHRGLRGRSPASRAAAAGRLGRRFAASSHVSLGGYGAWKTIPYQVGDNYLSDASRPQGGWAVRFPKAGLRLENSFDPAQVETCLSTTARRFSTSNCSRRGAIWPLAPASAFGTGRWSNEGNQPTHNGSIPCRLKCA